MLSGEIEPVFAVNFSNISNCKQDNNSKQSKKTLFTANIAVWWDLQLLDTDWGKHEIGASFLRILKCTHKQSQTCWSYTGSPFSRIYFHKKTPKISLKTTYAVCASCHRSVIFFSTCSSFRVWLLQFNSNYSLKIASSTHSTKTTHFTGLS